MVDVTRETKETRVRVSLAPGSGDAKVTLEGRSGPEADLAFARHMFETFAKWSGLDVTIEGRSKDDLEHHLVEDVAIALGQALKRAVDPSRIERVGHAYVPMDDALVLASVDFVNRPFYDGELPDAMLEHVLRSLATEAGITLHVVVLRGRDRHHVVEAAFKAVARAIRFALVPRETLLSTKGSVRVEEAG